MAGPIRQPIDLDKLSKYIDQNVPQIKTPLDVKQFGYGQSNPTYLLTDSKGAKYVMRKKPPGKLLSKTAHQVDREYRIIHALDHTDVPVPHALCLCEDDSVVGTPFYIMSFLNGRIFADPSIPDVSASDRKAMWKDALQVLAKFHRVAPKSVGLQDFGRANGFYNRQLKTFARISEAQAEAVDVESKEPVGKIPHYDEMVEFFSRPATQPKDRSTFVHGDYKIDNVVFHATEPRVIGILDWEMATIGHPLSDFCNLIGPYITANSSLSMAARRTSADFAPGQIPGLPTKEEAVAWYTEAAGFNFTPQELTWGEAFYVYRGSIIMQGIAARYAMRQASSEQARDVGASMKPFGELGWQCVQKCQRQIDEGGEKSRLEGCRFHP